MGALAAIEGAAAVLDRIIKYAYPGTSFFRGRLYETRKAALWERGQTSAVKWAAFSDCSFGTKVLNMTSGETWDEEGNGGGSGGRMDPRRKTEMSDARSEGIHGGAKRWLMVSVLEFLEVAGGKRLDVEAGRVCCWVEGGGVYDGTKGGRHEPGQSSC